MTDNSKIVNQYGHQMRGEGMTRIETFVAAAFAFAITMMVISIGSIPESMQEFILSTKKIPAFIASASMLMWIWYDHAKWSRWFGLEDTPATLLSISLIVLVLIYLYPLRIMMEGLFSSLTSGFLPFEMKLEHLWEARFMFGFYAMGLFLLSCNFIGLYAYAKRQQYSLQLSAQEIYDCQTQVTRWVGVAAVSVFSLALAIFLSGRYLQWSGFALFLVFPLLRVLKGIRAKRRKAIFAETEN